MWWSGYTNEEHLIRGGPGVTGIQNRGCWPWQGGRQGKLLRGLMSDRTFARWGKACQRVKERMGILGMPLLWHWLEEWGSVVSGERQRAQWATLWCKGTCVSRGWRSLRDGGEPEGAMAAGGSDWGQGGTFGRLLTRPDPYQTPFLTLLCLFPVTSSPLTNASQRSALSPQPLSSVYLLLHQLQGAPPFPF